MKTTLKGAFVIIALGLYCTCHAQIKATTEDGKKVILQSDGTWKYEIDEIEKDSSLLKKLSAEAPALPIEAGLAVAPVPSVKDSVVAPPPPPVVVRTPPNLDCGALINVQRSIDKQSFTGTLKKLVVSADSKTGFVISFMKTRHEPIVWTTKVIGTGICIDENTKMALIFKGGTTFNFANEGPANCDGNFKLRFGGEAGNDIAFDLMKEKDIRAIRIWNSKFSSDQFVHEYDAAIFRSAMNCLLDLK